MKKKIILITIVAIILILSILYKINYDVNNNAKSNKYAISQRDVEKTVKNIYEALINKNSVEYVSYINQESLGHLNSNRAEIKKSVDGYLKENTIKEFKIVSVEDFNEKIKTVTTLYKEISKDGHETDHDDVLFLSRNSETNVIEILYNGAVSSKNFEKSEVTEGSYGVTLNKTIKLIDGIGVNISIENKSMNRISLGYGTIFPNIILTTSDGESYNVSLNEVKIYNQKDSETFSSFTYESTEDIVKVEIQGVFELNDDGTPKTGTPKNMVLYEGH